MNEQIVTYKTAKLAKELGFNKDLTWCGLSYASYDEDGKMWKNIYQGTDAPSQAYLQKWLREVYWMHIGVDYDRHGWSFFITNLKDDTGEVNWSNDYPTYEEAMEAGLLRGLSEIEKKEA
jgi:hypothetical protein